METTASCEVSRRTRPSGSASTCSATSAAARAASIPAASSRAATQASTESHTYALSSSSDDAHPLGDLGEDVDRGIEQDGAPDALRVHGGELEDQAAAERVPDPVRLLEA